MQEINFKTAPAFKNPISCSTFIANKFIPSFADQHRKWCLPAETALERLMAPIRIN